MTEASRHAGAGNPDAVDLDPGTIGQGCQSSGCGRAYFRPIIGVSGRHWGGVLVIDPRLELTGVDGQAIMDTA